MLPFVVLIVLFVLFGALGRFHLPVAYGWWTSLRLALSGMFFLTASAHRGKRRPDLIRMVPTVFRWPDLLVTVTGILEIVGAVGLLLPASARYAGLGLFLMLLAVFPANVHAAQERLTIAGREVERLIPRALIQIVFLIATLAVFLAGKH